LTDVIVAAGNLVGTASDIKEIESSEFYTRQSVVLKLLYGCGGALFAADRPLWAPVGSHNDALSGKATGK